MKKDLEKLSSGYKINRAGAAAGLAIGEKMRAQITGLETAQKNAKDGINLLDGSMSLNETVPVEAANVAAAKGADKTVFAAATDVVGAIGNVRSAYGSKEANAWKKN